MTEQSYRSLVLLRERSRSKALTCRQTSAFASSLSCLLSLHLRPFLRSFQLPRPVSASSRPTGDSHQKHLFLTTQVMLMMTRSGAPRKITTEGRKSTLLSFPLEKKNVICFHLSFITEFSLIKNDTLNMRRFTLINCVFFYVGSLDAAE